MNINCSRKRFRDVYHPFVIERNTASKVACSVNFWLVLWEQNPLNLLFDPPPHPQHARGSSGKKKLPLTGSKNVQQNQLREGSHLPRRVEQNWAELHILLDPFKLNQECWSRETFSGPELLTSALGDPRTSTGQKDPNPNNKLGLHSQKMMFLIVPSGVQRIDTGVSPSKVLL